jgi:hypothetical protein
MTLKVVPPAKPEEAAAEPKKPRGPGGRRPGEGGRPKGIPNKTTVIIREALILAAQGAGGKDGLVGYLKTQAVKNPAAFLTLLGKVIPTQTAMVDSDGNDVPTSVELKIVRKDSAA